MTNLRTFTAAELKTILDAHALWTSSGRVSGSRANLRGSNLSYSDLSDSNLSYSDLSGSNLSGSNLSDSNLSGVRDDLRAVLDAAPAEVPGLLAALRAGRVDGSTYSGDCACLVGTIANVRGCNYKSLVTIKPDSSRPAERWFLAIAKGHTPETSQVAKITEGWIEEWMRDHAAAPVVGETGEAAKTP